MKVEEIYRNMPTLETERLLLRKVTMNDVEAIYTYGSDEEVAKYVTWPTHKSISDTEEFVSFVSFVLSRYKNNDVAPWAIEEKATGKMIGTIDFVWWRPFHRTAEIGYVLSRDYWGGGITTEAAREIVNFGFTKMNLIRIQARCFKENTPSKRVMEKVGMVFEGTHRKAMLIKDQHRDLDTFAIVKEE
ncbi:GNAT family N-acetyltransferase [Alteribacter aurantiacus]|uniref:GNAT family N-acetyltransferase n=1 Tax=Alteribacter aurantiacus TaxID=254410 RepID=UPI0004179208|nr:GNAT family protein [Alteribacter aurantiacus]